MIRHLWIAGLMLPAMSPGPGNAQRPGTPAPSEPAGQHCVATVEPIQNEKEVSKVEEGGCFTTLAEAVSVATDGELRLDPKTKPRDLTEKMLSTKGKKTIIAIDFDKPNFEDRSNSMTWNSNRGGCKPNLEFRVAYLGQQWNDRVSSVLGAGNCTRQYLFEHTEFNHNKKGEVARCRPSCQGFRIMDNKASSQIMRY